MCKKCGKCLSDEERSGLTNLGFTPDEIEKINVNEDAIRAMFKG